jgi:hypothetical protein
VGCARHRLSRPERHRMRRAHRPRVCSDNQDLQLRTPDGGRCAQPLQHGEAGFSARYTALTTVYHVCIRLL